MRTAWRGSRGVILLTLVAAFSFGVIVRAAVADHYHTNCVAHGFVHGDSTSDGSFFSRVDAGCGSTYRSCALYNYGNFAGSEAVSGAAGTCNAWSWTFGSYTECASSAHVYSAGVFSTHTHFAHNWCG